MAVQQTTPEEAQRLIGQGVRYIDVRTEQEFADGHPAGAVNIPVVTPDPTTGQIALNPDFLSVCEATFSKPTALIVGCQSGMRSQHAAELLVQAGYTEVTNMQGGFGGARDQTGRTVVAGWSASGLPVCRNCGPENSYAGLRGKCG